MILRCCMKRGVMIGRFQPFHLGHFELVKQILYDCNEIVIIIGSSQYNYTIKNPFTAGERIWMIHESLIELKMNIERILIIPVVNDENNSLWFSGLKSTIPPFDVIYTGNDFVKTLVQNELVSVKSPHFFRKQEFNGTAIRNLILKRDDGWKKLVPNSVVKILHEIKGEDRIEIVNKTFEDSPSSDKKQD